MKVYVPVAVLLTAGDHVPVTPLVEVVGKVGAVAPEQIAAIAAKVGNNVAGVTIKQTVVSYVHEKLSTV